MHSSDWREELLPLGYRHEEPEGYNEFLDSLRCALDGGLAVHAVLEPGDATHCEFLLLPRFNAVTLYRLGHVNQLVTATRTTSFEDVLKQLEDCNLHTAHLIAQLLSDAVGGDLCVFDWETARPRADLPPLP